MLLILSGASGAGKSTLCARLLEAYPSMQLSVSYTTRAPRGQEVDGVAYHFITEPVFSAMVAAGRFAEHARVHGNWYGTSSEATQRAVADGHTVLFDVDYQGAEALQRAFPDAVSVMVLPPSWEALEGRLRARGTDAAAVIARRLAKARDEMAHFGSFTYLVVNDDLETAVSRLRAIVEAERCRTARVAAGLRILDGIKVA